MKKSYATKATGKKTTHTSTTASQTSRVTFLTRTGHEQKELVKAHSTESLNEWIERYKESYCPGAHHTVETVGKVGVNETINLA